MPEKTIGLIAAMPEEILPFIRRIGPVKREKLAGFTIYQFHAGNKNVCLIESGIGITRAAQATRVVIDTAAPDVLLNFGFGGAILPGPTVGDVVVAEQVLLFKERLFAHQGGLAMNLTGELAAAIENKCQGSGFHILHGAFITTGEIVGKRMLAGYLPAGTTNPLVEMETSGIARVAHERQVPLVALRAISDDADEELGFSITDFTDRKMRVSIGKVLWALLRKPRLLPQLIRLGRNSRCAGENLAEAVLAALEGFS